MQPNHPPPRAWLVVESAPYSGRRIALGGSTLAIGSDPRCHLRPPDPQIAAVHATIHFHNGQYYVKDQRSGGRTFVNSQRVDLHPLCPGDVLALGGLRLRFEVQPLQSEMIRFAPLPGPTAARSHPAAPAAPVMQLPAPRHGVSWVARFYSLSMLLLVALVGVGVLSVAANAFQPPAPPPGFDPASASPVTLLYFYADW